MIMSCAKMWSELHGGSQNFGAGRGEYDTKFLLDTVINNFLVHNRQRASLNFLYLWVFRSYSAVHHTIMGKLQFS